MKVLVTGGAGFIGSHVCDRLLREPGVAAVRVIDDLSSGRADQVDGSQVELVHADILDADALTRAARGCSAIVHLAALGSVPRSVIDPMRTHEVNATGSLRVLEAARDMGAHVVLASSSSVYGTGPELPKHEGMRPDPRSPYAASKLAMEDYAAAYADTYQLPLLPLRFFNVYGPRQRSDHAYAAVIPAFLEAALSGRPLPVHGDGTQTRDFTYVESIADLIARVVTGRTAGGPTNAAFGHRHSLADVVSLIAGILGRELRVEHMPDRPGDVRHSQASQDLIRELVPDAVPVDLPEGLRRTIAWLGQEEIS
jgi:UDP-glucose 4-epimerase